MKTDQAVGITFNFWDKWGFETEYLGMKKNMFHQRHYGLA